MFSTLSDIPKKPVRLIHGMNDTSVPWQDSMKIMEKLKTKDVELTYIKDGDHRLSSNNNSNIINSRPVYNNSNSNNISRGSSNISRGSSSSSSSGRSSGGSSGGSSRGGKNND